MWIGISKNSPKFSSIEIISRPIENQKQKENNYQQNLKIIMSYNNENKFTNKKNMVQIKNNPIINIDYKKINEYNS